MSKIPKTSLLFPYFKHASIITFAGNVFYAWRSRSSIQNVRFRSGKLIFMKTVLKNHKAPSKNVIKLYLNCYLLMFAHSFIGNNFRATKKALWSDQYQQVFSLVHFKRINKFQVINWNRHQKLVLESDRIFLDQTSKVAY